MKSLSPVRGMSVIIAFFCLDMVRSFRPVHTPCLSRCHAPGLFMSASPVTVDLSETKNSTPPPSMPRSWNEMIRQVASAMKQAASQGQTRQIVRILLPDLTTKAVSQPLSVSDMNALTLVPPDESWRGGIMQLYRAAAPTCTAILRQLTQNTASGLPPRVTEDRSVDESGVDGVGLFTTEDRSVTCWLQPTQEILPQFIQSSQQAPGDQIVALMNPQWRIVDDALDSASQGEGFLSGLASMLGGKGLVLRKMREQGFTPVYTLEGYVCRNANIRLLQVLDSEWSVYGERSDGESYQWVGSSPTRPTYQQVDAMLQNASL